MLRQIFMLVGLCSVMSHMRENLLSSRETDVVGRSEGWVAGFGWRDIKDDLGEEKYFCLA